MGTVRKSGPHRRFTDKERKNAVEMVTSTRRPITHVAAELGISHKTLWSWVNQSRLNKIDPGRALTRQQRERIRDLEKENARLQRDVEFLKKANAFFRELDREDNGSL